jgi:hypothetical protein
LADTYSQAESVMEVILYDSKGESALLAQQRHFSLHADAEALFAYG